MIDPSISSNRRFNQSSKQIKLLCSFNGRFHPRPPSGMLRYTSGETRFISVDRSLSFRSLKSKISEVVFGYPDNNNNKEERSFSLVYHLPEPGSGSAGGDPPLAVITSDDDVRCMIDEYDKLESEGKASRLWIYVCHNNSPVLMNCVETENSCNGFRLMRKKSVFENRISTKKSGTSVSAVRSSDDSLRKIVLKQQLLAKQSPRIQSNRSGLVTAVEENEMECTTEHENHDHPLLDLPSGSESFLSNETTYPNIAGNSYSMNSLDYKYANSNLVGSENFPYLAPLPVSHSHPLNPKDGNLESDRQSHLILGTGDVSTSGNSTQLISAVRFPKPTYNPNPKMNSMVTAYDAKHELRSARIALSNNMNRENISPSGLDCNSVSCELSGRVYPVKSTYGSTQNGIRSHRFGLSEIRNQRTFPHQTRNRQSNFSETGNHRNVRFYPGIRSISNISKQGQATIRSYYPTSWKHKEGVARKTEGGLNTQTYSCIVLYENPNPKECHLAYHDASALLTGPSSEQCEVPRQTLYKNLEMPMNERDCYDVNEAPQGGIASCMNVSLRNLSLSSSEHVEPLPRSPRNLDFSEALPKPQWKPFDLMVEEQFGSGPQVEKSSGVASLSSSQNDAKLEKDNDEKAEIEGDPQSGLSSNEKECIEKTSKYYSKVNYAIPLDLAAFYTHLATRELQIIKTSDLEYVKELGSGTYGSVFYGKWKGSDVAIKRIKPSCFIEGAVEQDRLVADFWKEAHILGQLHHPNIVALYGVVIDGPVTNLATVTEYMVNGSLKQVLRRKDRTIDRRKRLIIAMDAAFGMEYLHEKNIVHFDLKSHNFLVNMRDPQRPVCKIGDLGLSKIKQNTLISGGVRGTIPWMAPELLNSKNMVTEKVDVYSFGIVMWELLTGEELYENMRSEEIIAGIIKGNLRPEIPSWCNPAWRSVMERCWSSDPDARPTFSQIAKELRAMAVAMNIK